ncbi:GumC family protein [Mangrovimonas xylaniphaga]|uniref:GumC family protein n=1 Tax=Mangrovimonas xylaniphaga TaxID=1645915 RepID=UPI0006B54D86|nr:polysaccharide biosynthesis tyrosine autokinase [Mangrovimonas xylaniphaga]
MKTEIRSSSSNDLREYVEIFTSHWKLIILSLLFSILMGYTYLRYSTFKYKANATIKIKDEDQSTKLPSIEEISNKGLFAEGTNKITDEIEILKSISLIENVVKNLDLNIRYFEEGTIKEKELYPTPPIKINFFEHDSVINSIDTTLYIKIKSPTEYLLLKDEGRPFVGSDETEDEVLAFGDRIKTGFGDLVIVPNIEPNKTKIDSYLKIAIKPVSTIADLYKNNIQISTETGSSVIKLELLETVPQKAIDVLNELITEYNLDVLSDKEEMVKISADFITKRLESVAQELEVVDFTAEQLQKEKELTALNSQADIFLNSEKQTGAEILNTTNKIQLITYLQDELKDKNRNSDLLPLNIGIEDSNIALITKNHNELVAQRDRILNNSSEKNPVVINLNNQIAALKLNLQKSLDNMKETSMLTLKSLNEEESRIRGQLYQAPTKQREFRDIKRQQDIKESLYLYLLQKREESAIRFGMYSPKAKTIDKAYSSYKPVAPNPLITYLGFFILGLVLPISYIYTKDLLDTKIHNKNELQRFLSIPYIGDIPKSLGSTNKLIKKVDYSPKAESFRILRTNINFLLKNKKEKGKTIFVTSTTSQEGKSHTSVNLALTLSYSNKKVLIIETDIRVPKMYDYLNINSKQGLTDFISDENLTLQDVITPVKSNENLFIIPSGTIPPNPAELLMNQRIEQLFKEVKKNYDYIVVDTAAVGLVTDVQLISEFADLFLFVVSANNVDRRQLHIAETLYQENRLPNMTAVLNGTTSKKGYGYGYGYGKNPNKKKWYNFKK